MSSPAPTKPLIFGTYFALLGLLVASAVASSAPFGAETKTVIAIAIAAAKTALIFWIFMQLKYQRGLVRIAALTGFFWLGIIGVLTFADFLTRSSG